MSEFPIGFNKWVNDNNPSEKLAFRKGWWDYIEFIRSFEYKYDLPVVAIVATYEMGTPPPEEVLTMPVALFGNEKGSVLLKWDFGRFENQWTLSIDLTSSNTHNMHQLFDINRDMSNTIIPGFSKGQIYGSYANNPAKFTCEVGNEWDVATLLRILLF
jgi:hypothetical protein